MAAGSSVLQTLIPFEAPAFSVTCKREGNRIVLIAGPDCQLAASGGLDTVTVAVISKKDEKQ